MTILGNFPIIPENSLFLQCRNNTDVPTRSRPKGRLLCAGNAKVAE